VYEEAPGLRYGPVGRTAVPFTVLKYNTRRYDGVEDDSIDLRYLVTLVCDPGPRWRARRLGSRCAPLRPLGCDCTPSTSSALRPRTRRPPSWQGQTFSVNKGVRAKAWCLLIHAEVSLS